MVIVFTGRIRMADGRTLPPLLVSFCSRGFLNFSKGSAVRVCGAFKQVSGMRGALGVNLRSLHRTVKLCVICFLVGMYLSAVAFKNCGWERGTGHFWLSTYSTDNLS